MESRRSEGDGPSSAADFSLHDAVKFAGLSRAIVLRLVKAGIVVPRAGRERRFSFPDLIVLRAVRGLYASNVSSRRVLAALRELRSRLPAHMPMSGLRVCVAEGDVVVQDGGTRWQALSGQLLLDFEALPQGNGTVIARPRVVASAAVEHFERACRLEDESPEAACKHYRRAISCDPTSVHAYINLGCLLHAARRWSEAESVYRDALGACRECGSILYNLAVLLEDRGEIAAAIGAYADAIAAEPGLADAHFNLARLYAALGRTRDALRAYNDYRRLAAESAEP